MWQQREVIHCQTLDDDARLCGTNRGSLHSRLAMATDYGALPSVPVRFAITGVGPTKASAKGGRDVLLLLRPGHYKLLVARQEWGGCGSLRCAGGWVALFQNRRTRKTTTRGRVGPHPVQTLRDHPRVLITLTPSSSSVRAAIVGPRPSRRGCGSQSNITPQSEARPKMTNTSPKTTKSARYEYFERVERLKSRCSIIIQYTHNFQHKKQGVRAI